MLAGIVLAAGPAGAGAATRAPALTIRLLDARQARVLASRAVRVQVRARRAGRYRVTLRSRSKRLAARTIRIRRGGRRTTIRLGLSPRARRTLASCSTRVITARVQRGRARAFVTSTYVLDPRRCRRTGSGPLATRPEILAASPGSTVEGARAPPKPAPAPSPQQPPPPGPGYVGYRAGAAKVSANPPEGERLCLGGYGACPSGGGRTMRGIRDHLYSRALAISQGAEGMILVHTTNIGLFASYKTAGLGSYHVRQEVARRTGVAANRVLVQADHSHSAPDTIGIWGGVPTSYLRLLQNAAIEAGVQAWAAREPVTLFAGTADGKGVTSSYQDEPNISTDDEFRLLWAEREDGTRVVTYSNYSPHATVLKSSNLYASGDWPEWAAQIAEEVYGGGGLGGVGTLGREDFGATGRDDATREEDAKSRLRRMIAAATTAGLPVPLAGGVKVRSVFVHEPMAQPILLLNLLPEGALSAPDNPLVEGGYDISIDRDPTPPFLSGGVVGTFAGAARIGDLFLGLSPGEPFPQIQEYLRDDGGVTGPRIHFHLGATNDFLGYMLRPLSAYPQVAQEGGGYLIGCPEEEIYKNTGIPYDDACTDHWTLMVSPTIGAHVACTIQAAGRAIGFGSKMTDPECPGLVAADGAAAPPERGG